jgi:cytoskeletal protein RodZ
MTTTEHRSGKERRGTVRRDDDACALCDKYREDEREREIDNEKEHDAMKKKLDGAVPWPTFSVLLVLVVGFFAWIATDHIGISRIVTTNTEIIKNHSEYIKEDREMQKVFYENQVSLMMRFGVEPKPLPAELKR